MAQFSENPQVMPSYKLTYFDIRGLAENARILFAAAKQPYEDVRLSLSFGTPGDFSTIQRGLEMRRKRVGEKPNMEESKQAFLEGYNWNVYIYIYYIYIYIIEIL